MSQRDTYREQLSRRLGLPTLSFRACRVIELYALHKPGRLREWLLSDAPQYAPNCGRATLGELRQAVGLPVKPEKPMTQAGRLAAAQRRVADLEAEVATLKWTVERMEHHITEGHAI
jgi:hypothetical protein